MTNKSDMQALNNRLLALRPKQEFVDQRFYCRAELLSMLTSFSAVAPACTPPATSTQLITVILPLVFVAFADRCRFSDFRFANKKVIDDDYAAWDAVNATITN